MSRSPDAVLFVFNPFTNDSCVSKDAASLSHNGFGITVIAHGGLDLKTKENAQDGVIVGPVFFLERKNIGIFGKIKVYLEYIYRSVKLCRRSDILHCNDLNTLPIGVIVKLFFNKSVKIVYDAYEYEINDRPNEVRTIYNWEAQEKVLFGVYEGLNGNIGLQFRRDENGVPKLIESNPRVQGTIVLCTASGYNMVYNSVKLALGESPMPFEPKWGTKMVRYWEEIFYDRDGESFVL